MKEGIGAFVWVVQDLGHQIWNPPWIYPLTTLLATLAIVRDVASNVISQGWRCS